MDTKLGQIIIKIIDKTKIKIKIINRLIFESVNIYSILYKITILEIKKMVEIKIIDIQSIYIINSIFKLFKFKIIISIK